jgi:hypothetical protein
MALAGAAGLPVTADAQRGSSTPTATPTASRPAAPPAAPRTEPQVPFKVGETLSYDVSWSSVLVAGTAVVSVKEKKPSQNSTAYYIVGEGRPISIVARLYALSYKIDTLFDSFSLLSQRGSLYAEEGKDRRTSTTRFDRASKRAFFEQETETTTKLDYGVPADTQDGLAALYSLRAKAFKVGDHISLPVADSGDLYRVEMNVASPQMVKTPDGSVSAWPLLGTIADKDGQPVWKNIGVWISDDARRLPVKLQADLPVGSFVLALRSVQ